MGLHLFSLLHGDYPLQPRRSGRWNAVVRMNARAYLPDGPNGPLGLSMPLPSGYPSPEFGAGSSTPFPESDALVPAGLSMPLPPETPSPALGAGPAGPLGAAPEPNARPLPHSVSASTSTTIHFFMFHLLPFQSFRFLAGQGLICKGVYD